eukprot:COSAG05_NODE_8346_length_712_cov_1.075041_2_plen_49_part_01
MHLFGDLLPFSVVVLVIVFLRGRLRLMKLLLRRRLLLLRLLLRHHHLPR